MNRRDLIKSAVGAAFAASLTPADALIGLPGGAALASNRPVGMNLSQIVYYSPELPFLNLIKSGGSSVSATLGQVPWQTCTSTAWGTTGEEAYLPQILDSDGYPTTLTLTTPPGGGQTFTAVQTLIVYNMGSPPIGATYKYPPGPYRFKMLCGAGSKVGFSGDVTALSNATGGATISGLTVSTTLASTYITVDLTVASPSTGIILTVTQIGSNTDYPRDMSLVLSSRAASFDSGSIFNPDWLAVVANLSSFRFMDWMLTNQEFKGYNSSTGSIASGSTSATLASAWARPSGTYPVVFGDGEQRDVTFTVGSTTATWTGGLTNTVSTTFGSQTVSNMYVVGKTWANRSKPSNVSWSLYSGIPYEIMVALANELSADIHVNIPMMYADADAAALAALIFNGTGMQSGFSPIASNRRVTWECSNEVWNPTFGQYAVAGSLGGNLWPGQTSGGGNSIWNRNWVGMRTAQMAQSIKTTLTTPQFAQCDVGINEQITNTSNAGVSLATSYWASGPASSYPITAILLAPYFPSTLNLLSTTDSNTITTQSDGGTSYILQCMTTNVMTGGSSPGTLSSVPSNGWVGQVEGYVSTFVSWRNTNYPALKIIGYEGGQSLANNLPSGAPLPTTLVDAANQDSGMGTIYYNFLTWWQSNVGQVLHLYNDVYYPGGYAWGAAASTMQTLNATNTPKWQSIQNFAQGH